MSFHDFGAAQGKVQVDVTTGSVAGVTIALSKANALFYGSVKTRRISPWRHPTFQPGHKTIRRKCLQRRGRKVFAGA